MPQEMANFSFDVAVYGNMTKYNETLSKARVRIFYKGPNRNNTYITDDFAETLLKSLPYTPVKGIYDTTEDDYTDHGAGRSLGRIYGIVPENPNVSWEKHVDKDGVEREYACADVLLFTALYAEASEIVGKPQSMEIYPPSIVANWQIIGGRRYYVFEEGCFLGLQVLGDEVEPCFEGAEFFSLYNSLKKMVETLENYSLENSIHGGQTMSVINFKLSDRTKFDMIWSLLNPNYSEEGNWEVKYAVCDVYDDYAVAYNYEDSIYERVYYTKNDADDSLVLGEIKRCFIVDVTEEEKIALNAIQALNGGNYEKIDENFVSIEAKNNELAAQVETYEAQIATLNENYEAQITALNEQNTELTEKNSEFEQKNAEQVEELATLRTERDDSLAANENFKAQIDSLTTELEELKNYKAAIEKKEKEAIVESYADQLSGEVLDSYLENLDKYTAIELRKELAFELVESNPSFFSKAPVPQLVPKAETLTGIEGILSKYTK